MTLPLIGITSIRKEGEPGQTHWYSTPFSIFMLFNVREGCLC